ncbi:DNA photolyase phr1 [Maublancomyces gigas]|uniref:DNA photolyase phr1 n=1 Tax=Discina gigas TaxID=1032678 RepID=A0ABR3GI77_9PEZI
MSSKRKAPASPSSASAPPRKTRRVSSRNISLKPETKKNDSVVPLSTTPSAAPNDLQHSDDSQDGLILREFYPPELSNGRALEYINGERRRPIETLNAALIETSKARSKILLGRSVVHWFRGDLRLEDNTALQLASAKARANKDGENAALIAMYILSPQDLEAHLTSPAKVDFILRTLKTLQRDLDKLNIPLHVEVVECREDLPGRVLELASEWDANHVYANTEYEVDELRRDANVIRMGIKKGIDFSVHHDLCIVNPGELATKSTGKQFSIYTPWFRAWIEYAHTHSECLLLAPSPTANPPGVRGSYPTLFNAPIPTAPSTRSLFPGEAKKLADLYPAGEHMAQERLQKFLKERITKYSDDRNTLSGRGTSMLSVHFANGTLSARQAVAAARDLNSTRKLNTGNGGIMTMSKPFKPAYANIKWPQTPKTEAFFNAWCTGRTGTPIVDAAMRELLATSHMHNRARMIVASFLCKDLLVDWRKGERFFMEHLIDGDFASNNGGWGWSSGTGVDPQPWFRIFNPLRQSEKFDPEGAYIRQWVKELRGVEGKAIHAPYERLEKKEFKKLRYPEPCVKHEVARKLCMDMYKAALGR